MSKETRDRASAALWGTPGVGAECFAVVDALTAHILDEVKRWHGMPLGDPEGCRAANEHIVEPNKMVSQPLLSATREQLIQSIIVKDGIIAERTKRLNELLQPDTNCPDCCGLGENVRTEEPCHTCFPPPDGGRMSEEEFAVIEEDCRLMRPLPDAVIAAIRTEATRARAAETAWEGKYLSVSGKFYAALERIAELERSESLKCDRITEMVEDATILEMRIAELERDNAGLDSERDLLQRTLGSMSGTVATLRGLLEQYEHAHQFREGTACPCDICIDTRAALARKEDSNG